jgi:hypothetical protein
MTTRTTITEVASASTYAERAAAYAELLQQRKADAAAVPSRKTTSNWNKSSKWAKKERTTDFIGTLPEGIATATLLQTKSTWSRPKQCKLGEDTMTLVVTRTDGSVVRHKMSLDIYAAKRDAAELLGAAPKPTSPTELTAAQAEAMGLVYVDFNGDARGYCYCCGRTGFRVNGSRHLSFHGFTRPGWGYTEGGCEGTGHTPEETLRRALKYARHQEARLAALLDTDLVQETKKRLEWKASQEGSFFAKTAMARFEESGFDPKHEEVNSTRYDLEWQQKSNARWLKTLEAVEEAQTA